MTKSNQTATRPAKSESDAFGMLMHRFVMANQRLTLAAHAVPEDYGPASCVVEEVTKALGELYQDFEDWDFKRRHLQKEVHS